MNFSCGNLSVTYNKEVEDIVDFAIADQQNFEFITTIFAYTHDINFSEYIIEIASTVTSFEITQTVKDILDDFFNTCNDKFAQNKGDFLELITLNLYDDESISKKTECLPCISNQKVEIYHNDKLLDKRLDVGFWNDKWIELHECKFSLKSFVRNRNKEKLIYMNKLYYELEAECDNLDIYLTTFSPSEKIRDNCFPVEDLSQGFIDFIKLNLLAESEGDVNIKLNWQDNLKEKLFPIENENI